MNSYFSAINKEDERHKMKGKINEKIARAKSNGDELMMNIPQVILMANKEIYIENHKGIEVYNPELIRVSTAYGSIGIIGKELSIDTVRLSDIFISGIIEKIELEF